MSKKDFKIYMDRVNERNPLVECPTCGKKFRKYGTRKHCEDCGAGNQAARFAIFKRDNFQCAFCGSKAYTGAELHVDHVHPKSKGGADLAKNLITACSECNLSKRDIPLDYATEQDILAEIARRNAECGLHPHLSIKIGREDRAR